MKRICFYISDHGFGHIARNIPIIASVLKKYDAFVYIVCGKNHIDFAKKNLSLILTKEEYNRIIFRTDKTDIGLIVKSGTLLVDTDKLTKACTDYLSIIPEKSDSESRWLSDNNIDAVLCDMPIWSIDACEKANIPLLYVGNFTWTELYREFLPEKIWQSYAEHYLKIKHSMLYALHNNEMAEFLKNSELSDTSITARPFSNEIVEKIKAKHKRQTVFAALGMSAQFTEPVDVSGVPYDFYTSEGVPLVGSNVTVIPFSTFDTQNYIAASDYVITKAGWGTVSECLLAKKPMALFKRETVLEDRTTVRLLEEKSLAVSINQEDLKDIDGIIKKLNSLNGSYEEFYDCADEVAEKLYSL